MKNKAWILLFIIGLVLVLCFPKPGLIQEINKTINNKQWHIIFEGNLAQAIENNPTGGTGFLEIFFINHTTTPSITFKQNSSSTLESWCVTNMPGLTPYANLDNFDVTISSSKLFDIVVRCSWNKTIAFDYNKNIFDMSSVRVNISTSGGGITISLSTSGINVASYNSSTAQKLWTNTYWNNGGTGYYIQKGGTCIISQIRLEGLY